MHWLSQVFVVIFFVLLIGCKNDGSGVNLIIPCYEDMPSDSVEPDVLLIGDSISLGYSTVVALALPQYEVNHNPCNARSSVSGLFYVDDWLNSRSTFEAIVFNFGIHDMYHVNGISNELYRENIKAIAAKIKNKTDRPLFLTTTRVPGKVPGLSPGREIELNQIALEVMLEAGVEVLDLYAVSENIENYYINSEEKNDVHFTDQGFQILGQAVADKLTDMLQN